MDVGVFFSTVISLISLSLPGRWIDGAEKTVRDLVEHNADVNIADSNGFTPLMIAVTSTSSVMLSGFQ